MPQVEYPLLSASFPDLAAELAGLLSRAGHVSLASQVSSLSIVDRCRCGDSFCATFYTASKPKGTWGPGHSTIPLDEAREGIINVDVLNGQIVSVEVLYRDDVRERLQTVCP
jgi:hypothetical protein